MSNKKKQKEANTRFFEEVEGALEKGTVYTKTLQERVREAKELDKKRQTAYLGTALLLSATMHQLEDLIDLGLPRMNVKATLKRTLIVIEKELDAIFDIKDENIQKEREAGITLEDNVASYVFEGTQAIDAVVKQFVEGNEEERTRKEI